MEREKTVVDRLKDEINSDLKFLAGIGQVPADILPEAPETPAAEAEATTAPEKVEPGKTDKEPQYAGKYKTVPELEKGYAEILGYSSTLSKENKQMREQLARFTQGQPLPGTVQGPQVPGSSPGTAQGVYPPQRSHVDWRKDDAVTRLAENSGIDPTYIADFAEKIASKVIETAEEAAAARVQAQIAPFQAQAEAEAYMRTKHPEAYNFIPEIQAFAEANQDVSETIGVLMQAGRHKQAMEYAWTQFRAAALAGAQTEMKANAKVAEAGTKTAKAAAAMPASSPGTPIHAVNPDGPDPKLLEELKERAKKGDYDAQKAYRRLTVTNVLMQDPNFAKIVERNNQEYGLR